MFDSIIIFLDVIPLLFHRLDSVLFQELLNEIVGEIGHAAFGVALLAGCVTIH